LIDAVSALEELTGERTLQVLGAQHRYHRKVFLAPPWPEIYQGDTDRRHGFEAGVAEFERLERVYPTLEYEVIMLPKVTVDKRADFVLAELSC
jgi:predicted ATPase